jgi:hypothetical protein
MRTRQGCAVDEEAGKDRMGSGSGGMIKKNPEEWKGKEGAEGVRGMGRKE